tara:strand:- start:514 stop:930 length:417 start_codon:yes stop_codon:yes gene_type:complete
MTSLLKDSHGVNFIASPKHPQSVTLLKYAEYHVRKVKNTIINNKLQRVKSLLKPTIKKIPRITSKITMKIAIGSTKGIKKSRLKTVGPKYSSNLNEKPTGSFNFIKPEKINNAPTKYLKSETIILIIFLNELMQKLRN